MSLLNLGQLFNTMDASPFHEKDLDHDAEEFIESWALEFPAREPVMLVVHLDAFPDGQSPAALIAQAVHNLSKTKHPARRGPSPRHLTNKTAPIVQAVQPTPAGAVDLSKPKPGTNERRRL